MHVPLLVHFASVLDRFALSAAIPTSIYHLDAAEPNAHWRPAVEVCSRGKEHVLGFEG